jgi:hypothetical protein
MSPRSIRRAIERKVRCPISGILLTSRWLIRISLTDRTEGK